MEELIPIVNELQSLFSEAGIQHQIKLPQIVVVGAQSSGKSSVLESLVGRDFLARGTGIVTRCPLRLQLVRTQEDPEFAVFDHVPGCQFSDFNNIREEITRATLDIVGTGNDISNKAIGLSIYSPRVLDITLIDLPGIVKVPVGNQPPDIARKIEDMILSYITPDNTIIMAISAANNDLANSDALQLARKVDPAGDRTISVLTKIDIMNRGDDAMSMLTNQVYQLKLGHIGVVCRSQEDINQGTPMQLHLSREEEFFASTSPYNSIAERQGIRFLSRTLNQLLMSHIKKTLPRIKREMLELLHNKEAELTLYGSPVVSESEKSRMLLKVIHEVGKGFNNAIEGRNANQNAQELQGGARINHIFVKIFLSALEDVDTFIDLDDKEILIAIMNSTGSKGVLFVPEAAFEVLLKKQITLLRRPCHQCLEDINSDLKALIQSMEVPEFQRFYNLKKTIADSIEKLLRKHQAPTSAMIENMLEVELSFINPNHPEFIDGATAIYLANEALAKDVPEPVFEKKPEGDFQVPAYSLFAKNMRLNKNLRGDKFVDMDSFSGENQLGGLPEPDAPSNKQRFEIVLIKILMTSYFGIVKTHIFDIVQKIIVKFLIQGVSEELTHALISELYDDKSLLKHIFEESPATVQHRTECSTLVNTLQRGLAVLSAAVQLEFL